MDQGRAVSALLALAFVVVGCASQPLPVADIPKPPSDDFPFGSIKTFDEVKAKFKGYHLTYIEQAQTKRQYAQNASETTFYGSIVAALGGAFESTATAIGGGLIAGGGSLYNDRYRLQLQAHNYETAASVMLCMYRASQDLSDANLAAFTLDAGPATTAAREIALDGLLTVRERLYRLQATFELGKPDANRLKEIVNTPKQKVEDAAGIQSAQTAEQKAITESQLAQFKNRIDQCVVQITG